MIVAHLRTLVWLRSRISWNQFTRGKKWVAVLSAVLQVLLAIGVVGLTLAGFLVGRYLLSDLPRSKLWPVLGGLATVFLFIWMISVLSEVQRSETIDVRRLMHLPISLRQVFVINYCASLFTTSLVLAVPASSALVLGLILGRGPHMAWLFPVLLAFFFVLTAWTYCLRGWLVNLMTNKRRRRAIIMGMTAAVILAGQLPNLVFNSPIGREFVRDRAKATKETAALPATPEDNGPSLGGTIQALPLWQLALPLALGGTLAGGVGLHRAYRVTVGFYTATFSRRQPRRRRREANARARALLVQRRIPFVSEQVSALTTALLRSNLRAPEMRMMLLMPVVMALVFGMMVLGRSNKAMPTSFHALLPLGAIGLSALSVAQFFFNVFGGDREAFRTLLLVPTAGRRVLLAKNLSLLPFSICIGGSLVIVMAIVLRLPPWTFLAACLQLIAVCLALCIPGNCASICVPYRMAGGSMRRPNVPIQAKLLVVLFPLTIPLVMIPVAIPPVLGLVLTPISPVAGALVNLAGSVCVLVLAILAYSLTLDPAGRYLQARALDVLNAVTTQAE